ncbi:hypothetical protein [Micromonospora pisi]|uniref:hypothetical protein n=1 Tax=Micromonospora pisi TaxID=589240 RepID=UPI000EAC23D4|nr:hypothetical protein [Micromonospora pisi]
MGLDLPAQLAPSPGKDCKFSGDAPGPGPQFLQLTVQIGGLFCIGRAGGHRCIPAAGGLLMLSSDHAGMALVAA